MSTTKYTSKNFILKIIMESQKGVEKSKKVPQNFAYYPL